MDIANHRIGCEKLCPTCEECEECALLDWALVFRQAEEEVGLHNDSTPINGPEDLVYAAIIDPEQLSTLLERCSRSRGFGAIVFVDKHDIVATNDGDASVPAMRPLMLMPAVKDVEWEWDVMTMVQGRAALAAIMKLRLDCGRQAVIDAFKTILKGMP